MGASRELALLGTMGEAEDDGRGGLVCRSKAEMRAERVARGSVLGADEVLGALVLTAGSAAEVAG